MNQKEIYGAIEFVDHEVRFVLGEFHNNQLNILKTESLFTDAIDKIEIVDMQKLVNNVKEVINTASEKMGFKINKVLLLIPSYSINRYSKRVKIVNKKDEAYFTKKHISKTVSQALDLEYNDDEVLINQVVNRYIIDGVSSSKLNLDKKISEIQVDVDIYTGPKALIFDYLSVIEAAGFKVLDIVLDTYAMAMEMALLDHSRNKNIILLKYERKNLTMSLLSRRRIISSLMIDLGYCALTEAIIKDNNISEKNAEKLILTNNYLAIEDNQKVPVFLYSEGNETKSIDDNYLHNLLMPVLEKQFNEISEMIKEIIDKDSSEVYITGKGASIFSLSSVCQKILNCKTKVYTPQILGARKGSLVSCLGAIYAYKDESIFDSSKDNSIDDLEFRQEVNIKSSISTSPKDEMEDSMANRFMELFKLNKDN